MITSKICGPPELLQGQSGEPNEPAKSLLYQRCQEALDSGRSVFSLICIRVGTDFVAYDLSSSDPEEPFQLSGLQGWYRKKRGRWRSPILLMKGLTLRCSKVRILEIDKKNRMRVLMEDFDPHQELEEAEAKLRSLKAQEEIPSYNAIPINSECESDTCFKQDQKNRLDTSDFSPSEQVSSALAILEQEKKVDQTRFKFKILNRAWLRASSQLSQNILNWAHLVYRYDQERYLNFEDAFIGRKIYNALLIEEKWNKPMASTFSLGVVLSAILIGGLTLSASHNWQTAIEASAFWLAAASVLLGVVAFCDRTLP